MKKLIIDDNIIKTAHDLYILYNEYLQDIINDAECVGNVYNPNEEPAYTIEGIRDSYQEIFEKVPHRKYKTSECFEDKCMELDLVPGFVPLIPKMNTKKQEEM